MIRERTRAGLHEARACHSAPGLQADRREKALK
jgi:hypothetical protein